MVNLFSKTAHELEANRVLNSEILVSFSGGKDSLVVLDLCSRVFKRVVCFFMYFVEGLEHIESQMKFAREKYGVKIIQVPHHALYKCLKYKVYCPDYGIVKEPKLCDIYDQVRMDAGINLIAMGAKRADSIWRKRNLAQIKNNKRYHDVIAPIEAWNKYDVLSYLKTHDIPLPPGDGKNASGVGLTHSFLLWCHDIFPKDFEKMEKIFPYIRAVVKQRDFYGA